MGDVAPELSFPPVGAGLQFRAFLMANSNTTE